MSFHYNNTSQPLTLPTTITRTLSNASFYGSMSISQRFERLGSGQELDLFGKSVSRTNVTSQMKFVRKVYIILLIQSSLINIAVIALVHFLTRWLEHSKYLWWVVLFPATIFSIIILWQLWTQYYQISWTSRVVLLCIYCSLLVFIISDVVSVLFLEYGVIVVTMSNLGIATALIYTFQTKYRFQGTKPIFCCIATICLGSIGLREWYSLNPVQILVPIAVASIVCTYFVLELYYSMGVMTVDDYILAYVSFHVDLAYPINCLHHLCEISDNVDDFPEYFNPHQPFPVSQ